MAGAKKSQREVPTRCPLTDGTPMGADGVSVRGSVVKPLHQVHPGAWEAKVIFSSGPDRVVGRLSVPFHVRKAELTAVLDAMAAKAAAEGAVGKNEAAVVPVPDGNETAAEPVNKAEL